MKHEDDSDTKHSQGAYTKPKELKKNGRGNSRSGKG